MRANPFLRSSRLVAIAAGILVMAAPAVRAAAPDPDADALSLTSAPPVADAASSAARSKLFVEGALGGAWPRDGTNRYSLRRASVDFTFARSFATDWRVVLSDRLDYVRPRDPLDARSDGTVNSLREAYVSWQRSGSDTALDAGRINLRYGPGFGYNPTDYFRDGSLRVVTTTNPLSQRENRLGTVVLRGQQFWRGGSVSVAWSPKLADRPSDAGASLDLGATNNRHRGLVVLGQQWSEQISSQLLFFKDGRRHAQIGASATALLGEAVVAHAEWSHGREPRLLDRTLGAASARSTRNRFSGGLTYTLPTRLSVTGEYEYNGFALNESGWLATTPALRGAYLLEAQRRQDLASRTGWLIYATQKSAGMKNLDVTALVRIDGETHSRLVWLELRHHWDQFDVALQLQQQSGRSGSQYALYPDKRSAQLLASYFF